MKSLSHIYENILDEGNIIRTMYKAFSGKKKTKSIKQFLAPESIGRNAENVRQAILDGTLPAQERRNPKIVHEPSVGKDRIIYPPHNDEHVLHHLVCQELEPMFRKGMYEFCVASVPGKGDSYGRKYMHKWIRSHHGKKLYVLKIDIHHFFDSIDRNILFGKLAKRIRDERFLDIIRKILWYDGDPDGKGIPIGFYTSQWFANFYLQDFDYYVKQALGAMHYMRYMDDIVILDTNKRKLWRIFYAVRSYLETELCLVINDNWQLFRFSYHDRKSGKEKGRAIDFMGYVFHHDRTTMRKRTLFRVRKKANRIAKHDTPTWYESTQMISRAGRMKHAQTYGYFARWIKSKVNMKKLRKTVSNYGRKKSRAERKDIYA
ncbi:MAG: RNA-directed DNA polymerase [Oscillospiraceae bacterium]|nr:RNA-directed DNA polymerase [Oscillospiraceae bacterium]